MCHQCAINVPSMCHQCAINVPSMCHPPRQGAGLAALRACTAAADVGDAGVVSGSQVSQCLQPTQELQVWWTWVFTTPGT